MIKKIFRDEHDAWVAINLGTRFSTRIVTIGLLVHYLSTQEVAAWYVFMAVFGLVSLAEAGLGRVMTRQVADRFKATSNVTFKTSDMLFLSTIFRFYRLLLFIVCTTAFLLGLWWFNGHVDIEKVSWLNLSWLFFVVANGVSLYSALYMAVLNGLGKVSVSQKNGTSASLVNLLVFIIVALVTHSLLVPTMALLISTLTSLQLNYNSLHRLITGLSGFKRSFTFRYGKAISARIAPELGKYFFMLLAFHLLTSAFILMLSHYETAEIVASYGVTMQLITLVLTFSNIWLTSSFPKMAAQKVNKNNVILKKLFLSAASRGVGVLLSGMLVVALAGNFLLNLIDSQTLLLPMDILQVVMAVIAVEYIIFTLLGQLLVSQSMMRFTYYAAIGSAIISLTALSILELGYGISVMFIGRIIIFMVIIAVPIIKDTKMLFSPKVGSLA